MGTLKHHKINHYKMDKNNQNLNYNNNNNHKNNNNNNNNNNSNKDKLINNNNHNIYKDINKIVHFKLWEVVDLVYNVLIVIDRLNL